MDQHWFQFGSGSQPLGQCGYGSMVLMTKYCTILQLKFVLISKIAIYLSQGLHEREATEETFIIQKRIFSPFLTGF